MPTLSEMVNWVKTVGEVGVLKGHLKAGIKRPLGRCGCDDSEPILEASQRPSQRQGGGFPIACARCPRCRQRFSLGMVGTPYWGQRNRLGLVKLFQGILHWACSTSMVAASREWKIWRGTLGQLWGCMRQRADWFEKSRPILSDLDVIVDLTWGSHRRVAAYGVPSRTRHCLRVGRRRSCFFSFHINIF